MLLRQGLVERRRDMMMLAKTRAGATAFNYNILYGTASIEVLLSLSVSYVACMLEGEKKRKRHSSILCVYVYLTHTILTPFVYINVCHFSRNQMFSLNSEQQPSSGNGNVSKVVIIVHLP